MMLHSILVPLDGSPRAEEAIPIAARIARANGSKLMLIRVHSLAWETWPAAMATTPLVAEALVETSVKEAADYLERIAASPERVGLSLQFQVLDGPIASALLNSAISSRSDLIVLCRHGATGLTRWALGSVARAVVRQTPIPVLVVSEGNTHLGNSPTDLAQPLRMLIPLDGSDASNAALDLGSQMLTALAAPGQKTALHLAYVARPSPMLDREFPMAKAFLQQTTESIQRGLLAPVVHQQSTAVTWSVLIDTDVASALLRVVEQGEDTEGSGVFGGCHLIAMATHGRGRVFRRMIGSVTERVLSATRRPILLIPPPQDQREQPHTNGA
jgi:nucleotide-binding universal stress UspA family protein